MVETMTGHNRSNGISYDEILRDDIVPPPAVYLENSPMPPGVLTVPVEQYFSREQHDLEVDRLWKRVWQMACHRDDIPNVGDVHVYDIASLSFIVVHETPGVYRAFPNACLHRGRALFDKSKRGQKVLRCSFHGWSWNLNGKLREVPCQWDFPTVDEENYSLPDCRVGEWGGFIFINPDPDCEPLEDFIGDLDRHFGIPFEQRFKAAHLIKKLPCNWKAAQEAFMESYHVVATHPELLPHFGDANSKYDVWGNFSRAISPSGPPSPHTSYTAPNPDSFPDRKMFSSFLHPLSGHHFLRLAENRVEVRDTHGVSGIFDMHGDHLEGELLSADAHMCNWVGGRINAGEEDTVSEFSSESISAYRGELAAARREQLRPVWGDAVATFSDADLTDSIFYSVFPNLSPWADHNPIFYRFRPDGDNPEQCLHEVMFMVALPEGMPRPPAAKCTYLGLDDDYTLAPEFGSTLAKIFNQDALNHAMVQKGLHSHPKGETIYGSYQESKIRHFHQLLDRWLTSDAPPRSNSSAATAGAPV